MDLANVEEFYRPRSRADLGLHPGDAAVAGGTWLMSQPQPQVRRLIDLTALRWPDLTMTASGLTIAATCPIATLLAATYPADWAAVPAFAATAKCLLASHKIWHSATVGGNVCLALPAGSFIGLLAVLDATLVVWRADGSDDRLRVDEFVVGSGLNTLGPGDVLRAIEIPAESLRRAVAIHRVSPARLGRSAALVMARRTSGGTVVSVTAATVRPYRILLPDNTIAPVDTVLASIDDDDYFTDAHGTAAWRRAMVSHLTALALQEIS